jgi:hypothetical protein
MELAALRTIMRLTCEMVFVIQPMHRYANKRTTATMKNIRVKNFTSTCSSLSGNSKATIRRVNRRACAG